MELTSEQLDRAAGVLLGAAVGDALGVPYEFGSAPLAPGEMPEMIGGGLGPYAPGEWSDDTQMTLCIALALIDGADARTLSGLNAVAQEFLRWVTNGATDVGAQTSLVLELTRQRLCRVNRWSPAEEMRAAAELTHTSAGGRSAGNGALMRTSPIALRYLSDQDACADAAITVSGLTHFDPLASQACVIWCEAIRVAVLTGSRAGAYDAVRELVPARWEQHLDEAFRTDPAVFENNGFVVTALQAAWAAITSARGKAGSTAWFRDVMYHAVHAGNDTDTVAAIAGALAGAVAGANQIPFEWRRQVNGWPGGMNAANLTELGTGLAVMS